MRSKLVIVALAILTLCSLTLVACSVGTPLRILERSITVQEFTADPEQSSATVKGIARNEGGWPIQECTISVSFFDYQGKNVGTHTELRQWLEAGETWDFSATLKGKDAWQVARYTLSTACK